MARSVWDYFEERDRECRRLSLVDDDPIFAEEAASDGKRGRLLMRLQMGDRAYLAVSETVVVRENHVHREEYAYFLVMDGQEYWGRERDPTHDPPEHGHTMGHERIAAGRITFKDAVHEAWEIVSQEEERAEGLRADEE